MDDRIKDLLRQMFDIEPDYSTWKQVAKLTPEEIVKRRGHERACAKMVREFEILKSKVQLLKAKSDTESKQWWHSLHEAHSLPEASYHITEDGRILVDPKSMPKKTME